MNALRAMPSYDGYLLSLQQLWPAAQIPRMSARFTTLRVLEHVQREPHDADLYPGWSIRRSDGLGIYLRRMGDIVRRHLHLTNADAAAWWVKQDLHTDAIKEDPRPWSDRIDVWRFEVPKPAPEVRIRVAGFGVRVALHDPATDERIAMQVFDDLDAAVTFGETTLAQHCQDQGWQRNAASEVKMLKQDIPALVAWYVEDTCPPDEHVRERLQDLARDVLILDPPRRNRPNFLRDLAKKGGYDASDE
jgi:hypothetical protein